MTGGGSLDTSLLFLPPPHTHTELRTHTWTGSVQVQSVFVGGRHHGSAVKGQLFHWSTLTSYFLDDPAPSGEVIG